MRKATLVRTETGPEGTFGLLSTDSGFSCYIVERPWLDNKQGESCIPAGLYRFRWRKDSPLHGEVYEAEKVLDRTNIQIHSANWADQLLGCLAPGRAIMDIKRPDGEIRKGVTSSRDATAGLVADLGKAQFDLAISWAPGVIKT